jgi:hypothetical protein
MTQITSPHAVAAAGGRENIGTRESTDTAQFTFWRAELQTRTRGTHYHNFAPMLQSGDAMALLLWINPR